MYVVTFLYPNGDSREFDRTHFADVHLPLGLGLTRKHFGIVPERVVLYSPCFGGDGEQPSAAFSAISSVFFSEEQAARTFLTLFTVEEAAQRLSADFPNYTPGAPNIMMAEVETFDNIAKMLEIFDEAELQRT